MVLKLLDDDALKEEKKKTLMTEEPERMAWPLNDTAKNPGKHTTSQKWLFNGTFQTQWKF